MVIAVNSQKCQKCWKLLTGQPPMLFCLFPCSSHLDNLNVPETLKTSPPGNPQANFGERVKSWPPGQIFLSNALPLGNFQRSNPQRPGRFSIFLLLMNNLSLRFRRRCFLPAMEKKLIPKNTTHILNQTDCL